MALKPISKIAAGVQASTTLAIDSLFKQMKAEGKDVVGFGAGEPDFPTPEHIKQAGIEAPTVTCLDDKPDMDIDIVAEVYV